MNIKLEENIFSLDLMDEHAKLEFVSPDTRDGDIIFQGSSFDSGNIANIKSKSLFRRGNEEFQFIKFANSQGIAYRRIIHASQGEVKVKCLSEKISFSNGSELFPDADSFCFHAENTRLYERFTMPSLIDRCGSVETSFDADEAISGTLWAGEGNLRREVGRSPFQPFPAMVWGKQQSSKIFIDGTLTQKRLYRYYTVENGKYICFQAPKTITELIIEKGRSLVGEWNYIEVAESFGLNHPYSGFLAALDNFKSNYTGSIAANHKDMIWGSWNDGIFRDIDQKRILENADFIKKHFPTVKWVQIDDGYDQWDYSDNNKRVGIGVAYPGEGFSKDKFPDGPRAFTDEIKKRGLRPALWVGLSVSSARLPFLEHPEWFVEYCQAPTFRFLDISREDVREFVRKSFRIFFQEWGFEGLKLDFWSYFFEDEQIVLENGTVTGGEYRDWFLKTCREFMPKDGYLQTGCDIAMANIHLAEYVDNYRYGIDIGNGNWTNVKTNAKWAAFCLNTHSGKYFVPNSDSVGYFPGLSKQEAQTAINFCLVTRTLLEIAGWLYQEPENPLLSYLVKACTCPNNGEDVYFGGFNFKESDQPPIVWYLKSPHFSEDIESPYLPLRTAGIFNWENEAGDFKVNAESFGLDPRRAYILKDFWSDEIFEINGNYLTVTIEPHHSRLFSISESKSLPMVLDSNIQLKNVKIHGTCLDVEIPFQGTIELHLNFQPEKIIVNAAEINYKSTKINNIYRIDAQI